MFHWNTKKMKTKSEEWYIHEAKPSRGTNRSRDEEQTTTKQTAHMNHPIPSSYKQKKKKLQQRNRFGTVSGEEGGVRGA